MSFIGKFVARMILLHNRIAASRDVSDKYLRFQSFVASNLQLRNVCYNQPVHFRHPRARSPVHEDPRTCAGTTIALVIMHRSANRLAPNRETTRPVASSNERTWPSFKSPILHPRLRLRYTFSCRHWCWSECYPALSFIATRIRNSPFRQSTDHRLRLLEPDLSPSTQNL